MVNMDLFRKAGELVHLDDELSEIIIDELRESGEDVDSAYRARLVLTDDGEVWAEVDSNATDNGDPDGEYMAYFRFSQDDELVELLDQGTFMVSGSDPAAYQKVIDHYEKVIEKVGSMEVAR